MNFEKFKNTYIVNDVDNSIAFNIAFVAFNNQNVAVFIVQLNIFENSSFTDRMIIALNYNVFFNYITLILIIHNNITNNKNIDLTRNMFKTNLNHDRCRWSIVFLESNERKQRIVCTHSRHWRCMKIFSLLIYIKSMIHSSWYSVFFFTVCMRLSTWI